MVGRRISVALCTFDGADFLEEQLASIAAQTIPVDEIVVADDGSTDGTLALLAAAAVRIPGLRVLPPTTHLGVTKNFERAVEATTGDVILLSDQDDRWHRDRVAAAIAVFDADPTVLLVHSDARLIDAHGQPLAGSLLDRLRIDAATRTELEHGRALAPLLQRNVVTGATVAFRRELLARALPLPDTWLHDEWLAVMAAVDRSTRLVPEELIDYRLHGANEVGATRVTLAVRMSRLTAPRRERNARLLARARALAERLSPGPAADEAEAKVAHEEARSAYPAIRIARLGAVLREARTGRYRR